MQKRNVFKMTSRQKGNQFDAKSFYASKGLEKAFRFIELCAWCSLPSVNCAVVKWGLQIPWPECIKFIFLMENAFTILMRKLAEFQCTTVCLVFTKIIHFVWLRWNIHFVCSFIVFMTITAERVNMNLTCRYKKIYKAHIINTRLGCVNNSLRLVWISFDVANRI